MTHDARPSVGRVLFVTHNVPRWIGDAAGSFVLRLAVALQDQGVNVDVLAPGSRELQGPDVVEGVAIERMRYASPERMTLAYSGTMAEEVRATWSARFALLGLLWHTHRRIRQKIRDASRAGAPYALVHAHWWFPSGVSAWAAGVGRSLSLPLVVTMHGSDVRLAHGTPLSHGVMQRVLKRARVVTAVSRWLATTAEQIAANIRIDVSPMPVDTSIFAPPSTPDLREGILFVGRLNAQKGVADLLNALAIIPDERVQLHIVGEGPDESALRLQAASLGVSHRVVFMGALRQQDVVHLYQRARVVAIPSREEGLGLVAVEAQLCGTPVVAYASGGLLDVVLPERGGTLVQPGDIEGLASALSRFMPDSSESEARIATDGVAARQQMLNDFSPESVARKYIALYQRAVAAA